MMTPRPDSARAAGAAFSLASATTPADDTETRASDSRCASRQLHIPHSVSDDRRLAAAYRELEGYISALDRLGALLRHTAETVLDPAESGELTKLTRQAAPFLERYTIIMVTQAQYDAIDAAVNVMVDQTKALRDRYYAAWEQPHADEDATTALRHARSRFEQLAADFKQSGDVRWAMCDIDATMMDRAIGAATSKDASAP